MGFKPKLEPSSWDPKFEESLLQKWEKEDIYRFNKRSKLPKFVIDTPPPYPSGKPWHIGLPHSTAR
jgi:valyl-tRNA synthetase